MSAENFLSERNYEDIETQFCTYIYKSLLLDDDTLIYNNYQNDFYLNIYRESLELIMNDYDKKHFHIDKGNKCYLTAMIHILKPRGELKKVINQLIADYFKTPYFSRIELTDDVYNQYYENLLNNKKFVNSLRFKSF